jgi:hypothetical protein
LGSHLIEIFSPLIGKIKTWMMQKTGVFLMPYPIIGKTALSLQHPSETMLSLGVPLMALAGKQHFVMELFSPYPSQVNPRWAMSAYRATECERPS